MSTKSDSQFGYVRSSPRERTTKRQQGNSEDGSPSAGSNNSTSGDHQSESRASGKSSPPTDMNNLKGRLWAESEDAKKLQDELQKTADELEAEANAEAEKNRNSKWRKIQHVIFKGTALLVAVAVVVLCLISAILSIKKLLDTKDKPASTYQQKLHSGPYQTPGLIFLGEDIQLHSCTIFNFTSLNVDSHENVTDCPTKSFTLDDKSSLDQATLQSLPEFLQDLHEVISLTLIPGPSDWETKETIQVHTSMPNSKAGIWVILHPDYKKVQHEFEEVGTASEKWSFTSSLILENSMNFASAQFRSFFLMSKQEFKSFGSLDAVRIDMEITLMEQNKTELDLLLGDERSPLHYVHMEAFYQWKDGYFMEGDQFYAITIWAMFTIMASALLMLERGYNTLKRVLAFKMSDGKAKISKKEEQQQIEDQLQREEEELNEKQRAFDEAPPDSRPSTAQSDMQLTDAELDIMEEDEEEEEQRGGNGPDSARGRKGEEEDMEFNIFRVDNQ
ncbi:uncharacterized protein LOC142336998 [Convolutriloba macropyga]|uniref:uncharacterized protein LOC142336998 n=1 Tax=Convolutriloba macropyga TaxID=536237 RepID=UPI003F51C5ED